MIKKEEGICYSQFAIPNSLPAGRQGVFAAQSGFSLVEVMVSVGILGGIILVIGLFAQDIGKFNLLFTESFTVQQEIALTLRELSPQIRSVATANDGSYPIISVGTSSFAFFSDIDKDGLVDRVRYFLSGTTLWRGVTKPAGNPLAYNTSTENIVEVVHNVVTGSASSTDIFSYFDSTYSGTQSKLSYPITIANVRSVEVRITADQASTAPAPVTLSIFETIRNLRTN
jgi:prepilin-type N-terminal cleavage/methylation domain-containing protein